MGFNKEEFLRELDEMSILELQQLTLALEEYFNTRDPIDYRFVCPSKRSLRNKCMSLKTNKEVFKLNGGDVMTKKKVTHEDARMILLSKLNLKDTPKELLDMPLEKVIIELTSDNSGKYVYHNDIGEVPRRMRTYMMSCTPKIYRSNVIQGIKAIENCKERLEVKTLRDVFFKYSIVKLMQTVPQFGLIRAKSLYKFMEHTMGISVGVDDIDNK